MKTFRIIGKLFLQFFPLTIFLKIAFFHGVPQAEDWLIAFLWGGSAAFLQLLFLSFFARKRPLNRMILGVNCYLIFGCVAVFTNRIQTLETLNYLKESGMLLFILIIGIITTFSSKYGFVGSTEVNMQRDIRNYSIVLILLTAFAVLTSFIFKGKMLFSVAIPFIILSASFWFLNNKLQRTRSSSVGECSQAKS